MNSNTPKMKDCLCGCGETVGDNQEFKQGHDQKLRIKIEKAVGGLAKLKELVENHLGRPISLNT